MHFDIPHKTKQFFFVLIKLSIVIGAFYFIYSKLAENVDLQFNDFLSFLIKNDTFSLKTISFLVILSCFNWLFEIIKWQSLVKTIKIISFSEALQQCLGGLTASLITPNRIGDYGTKVAYFKKVYRTRIVLLNLLGNIWQMIVTTIFGSIGLLIFVNRYHIDVDYYKIAKFIFLLLLISALTILGITQKRFSIKGYAFNKVIEFAKKIPWRTHLNTFLFSVIRYLIFSFQFYYLLIIFGVEVVYTKAMTLITSMYLLASVIPTISFFDVVIKGSVAVFLFGYVDVNELTVLSIITLMWLFNYMIPSLFGSCFILNFKLPITKE